MKNEKDIIDLMFNELKSLEDSLYATIRSIRTLKLGLKLVQDHNNWYLVDKIAEYQNVKNNFDEWSIEQMKEDEGFKSFLRSIK